MAHFWFADKHERWQTTPLDGGGARRLTPDGLTPADAEAPSAATSAEADAPLVHPFGEKTLRWALVTPPGVPVRVNGAAELPGVRVLDDRDEIVFHADDVDEPLRLWFSNESLAVVESFESNGAAVSCPRCKMKIAEGAGAVRCPACNTWHHENEERACWTYSDHCALCDQQTALDAGFRWTPEGL